MPDGDKTIRVRDQILDEATRLFAAQGFGATSVQAIAEAVGIRKPSLLYHFESKELLRDAVLERILARWNELLPGLLVAAAKENRFDGVMSALTSFFLEDPDRARLLLREVLDRPTELRALLVKHVRPWVQVVSDQLERARREGYVHEDVDVEAYAVHVIHLVVGGVAVMETMGAALGGRSKVTRERMTKELVRLARAGLFVDPSVRRARVTPPASERALEIATVHASEATEKSAADPADPVDKSAADPADSVAREPEVERGDVEKTRGARTRSARGEPSRERAKRTRAQRTTEPTRKRGSR